MPVVRRELDDFERGEICGMHKAGKKPQEISNALGIPRTTIQNVLKNPRPVRSARTGRPLLYTERDQRHILQIIKKTPNIIYAKLVEELSLIISPRTVRRMLYRLGIKKWIAKKRPMLTEVHAKVRLKFALKYKDWSYEEWCKVIFSNECSIQRGSSNKRD
jgi:transposase